jgi:hypothetical protein
MYTGSKLRSGKITRSLEAISFPTLKPGPMTPVVRDAQSGKRSPEPRFVYRHSHGGCLSFPYPGLSGVADTGGGVAEAHKGVVKIGIRTWVTPRYRLTPVKTHSDTRAG